LAAAHADPALVRQLREAGRRCPGAADGEVAHAMAEGRPLLFDRADARRAAALFGCDPAREPTLVEALRGVGIASLLFVPIALGNSTWAALAWGRGPTHAPFTADDLALAGTLAERARPALVFARRLVLEA